MRIVILAIVLAMSSAGFAGTPFSPAECVESVERLKKAAKEAADYAEQAANEKDNSKVSSALSDVENKLSRARLDCGAPDFCTSLKFSASKLGSDAVYAMCQAYETGNRLAICKACLGK